MDRSILEGIYDVHVHAGPSTANRAVDAGEMLLEAEAAGYAGFVVKDHYIPALLGTKMVEKHLGKGKTKVYGSTVLNNSVGGFNVHAVDAAYQFGAAMVYFPTISSEMHIEDTKEKGFPGAGAGGLEETPIPFTDENDEVVPEAVEVLKYIAEKNMVLATGHGTPEEVDAVVRKAVELGVEKILVTHPHYQIGASLEQMKEWAELGAYIEINACVFEGGHSVVEPVTKLSLIPEMIEAAGIDKIIIDTDFGQAANGSPVEGLYNFLVLLESELGITEEEINIMTKKNPKDLFDFENLNQIN